MSDLIDRQDVLNILREESTFYGITEKILKLRSIPQWIPCKERLPECFHIVLLTVEGHYLSIGYRTVDRWIGVDRYPLKSEPIAWMEFPEPWKGEEE